MDDVQRTACLVDLTNDDASISNLTVPCIDLTENEDHCPELIDLTEDDNQHFNSKIPVIDLTDDNSQFLNYRIPVIDLTNDDVLQTQYIDLTSNDASSRNFRETGHRETNHNTKLIDLSLDDIQDLDSSTPVIDLTCDSEQFVYNRIQDIDMANDDVHDITELLQNFDLAEGKQENTSDCIPTTDLTNNGYTSTHRILPVNDRTSDKYRPTIDLIRNNERILTMPAEDLEMLDLSCNNSNNSLRKCDLENIQLIPKINFNDYGSEDDLLKYSETSNLSIMHNNIFSSTQKFHHREEISVNRPLKKNSEDRIKTTLMKYPLKTNFEENNLSPEKSKHISQIYTSEFPKPAHHPIPLRHSLGRSTVNTSQNVPFEYTEALEAQPRTSTVSSIIRRKKSKSISDASSDDLLKLKKPSMPRETTLEAFKEFFRKFWIILLFAFIGLYYWI